MELRIFTEPQMGASYGDLLAVAQAAEELGFGAFFRSDHFLTMGGDGLPGPTDAWVTLGALARETRTIRLGTLVTSATFRLPGVLAVQVAQVDAMSGGRVELGLGAGWFEREHEAYGVPFPPLGERFERLGEQLAIVTGLWATPAGETFSHTGKHYTLVDSPALPKPVQSPVPVIVGGAGQKRTPAYAARYAQEFNTAFRPVDVTAGLFDNVRRACAEAGRDPATLTLSCGQLVLCGRDDAEVARRAIAIGRDPSQIADESFVGTPDVVIAKLRRIADLGASRAYLQVMDLHDLDHLELIAREVLPAAREM
ncbi:MAG TPA: LLM class F420-dependent oxidoreductase [Mycobacteriales bacterium]|nr:LLM class F420-dependent oxidoreductase [Mycobacteriales bacterium]